jgi:hypothetical protein
VGAVALVIALVIVVAASSHTGHPAATPATSAPPPRQPPVSVPSPASNIDRFLAVYAHLFDGQRRGRDALAGITTQAWTEALAGQALPARYRRGQLRPIRRLQGLPAAGVTTAAVAFMLRNARYTFRGGIDLQFATATGWTIVAVNPPDFDVSVAPATRRSVPSGLAVQARRFTRGYIGFLEFTGSLPFATVSLQDTIATNRDPLTLAGVQPTGARLRAVQLSYGIRQGQTVAVTAAVELSSGTSATFSVLMRRIVGGWRAQGFLGPATSRAPRAPTRSA